MKILQNSTSTYSVRVLGVLTNRGQFIEEGHSILEKGLCVLELGLFMEEFGLFVKELDHFIQEPKPCVDMADLFVYKSESIVGGVGALFQILYVVSFLNNVANLLSIHKKWAFG